jgi:hypothetical protein
MAKTLSTLADKVDQYYSLREARLAMQHEVEDLQKQETELKNYLIDNISKADATGVSGKLARVTVVSKPVPQVKDWDAFWKYVVRRKAFDLVQRRLSDTAVKLRWEDGQVIPGVESFPVISLSLNKV